MRPECWTSQVGLSCNPWKSIFHDSTTTDVTHICMPGCESIFAVTASWLISVCGFCLCGIRGWKFYVWWYLGIKEFLNLTQRCWVERAGPIPWPGRLCDNDFWDNFTELIYITPLDILLMEQHNEIEHVLRPAVFWDCTKYKLVIPFRCLGITNQSYLAGPRFPRRNFLIACIHWMSVSGADC